MYYQNYEDYMRSILGYPVQTNTYNYSNALPVQYEYVGIEPSVDEEINNLYPEIYKLLNPMVCKICESNTKPITRELLEQMTDEIYLNIESETTENVVNIRVETKNDSNHRETNKSQSTNILPKKSKENRKEGREEFKVANLSTNNSKSVKSLNNKDTRTEISAVEEVSTQSQGKENRQVRRQNNTLRDLIKILILNRLLSGNRPRPPYPGRPRPPFPGGPGANPRPPLPGGPSARPPFPGGNQGGPRPPIEPRYVL